MGNTVEETLEKSLIEDPELREPLEKEALKGERKRAKKIYEISGRHQIPSEIVEEAIYGNPFLVADFRGIVLDYREKQGTANAMQALELIGLGMSQKEVQGRCFEGATWLEHNQRDGWIFNSD